MASRGVDAGYILSKAYNVWGESKLCQVDLTGEYNSDLEYFDFDSDMEPLVVARAMAREVWDKQYFQRIRYI